MWTQNDALDLTVTATLLASLSQMIIGRYLDNDEPFLRKNEILGMITALTTANIGPRLTGDETTQSYVPTTLPQQAMYAVGGAFAGRYLRPYSYLFGRKLIL